MCGEEAAVVVAAHGSARLSSLSSWGGQVLPAPSPPLGTVLSSHSRRTASFSVFLFCLFDITIFCSRTTCPRVPPLGGVPTAPPLILPPPWSVPAVTSCNMRRRKTSHCRLPRGRDRGDSETELKEERRSFYSRWKIFPTGGFTGTLPEPKWKTNRQRCSTLGPT